ncbi:MAG: restriction endonuclease [Verrucomicrobiota bacterium]|nr:restriction endonuclease [Verrucomicrobiota bacterium]
MDVLQSLGFGARQSNEVAAYVLLSLLDLKPHDPWSASQSPLRGITPMITFIRDSYGVSYAPNTRETIRDEAVKYFVGAGMVLRNPDNPQRPTNSGNTVYQIEPSALALLRTFGTLAWPAQLKEYLSTLAEIRKEIDRHRNLARIPVKLPSGETVTLSPGGQNPLIKAVIEDFCPRFVAAGTVAYIGDTEDKFLHLDATYLGGLGVVIAPAAKMPDVVVHDTKRNWLVLIEAVSTAGPVDGKRRKELKELFQGCRAGLVFVTAFENRSVMQSFLSQISWETEVWVADVPDHLIHFNGERFLGPYPDVLGIPPS